MRVGAVYRDDTSWSGGPRRTIAASVSAISRDVHCQRRLGQPGLSDHIGTVHYPRLVPKDEQCARELKKRTLTNLYNQRPAWLGQAHRKLDEAVFAAYGPPSLTDDELLARLLELNLVRAQ